MSIFSCLLTFSSSLLRRFNTSHSTLDTQERHYNRNTQWNPDVCLAYSSIGHASILNSITIKAQFVKSYKLIRNSFRVFTLKMMLFVCWFDMQQTSKHCSFQKSHEKSNPSDKHVNKMPNRQVVYHPNWKQNKQSVCEIHIQNFLFEL